MPVTYKPCPKCGKSATDAHFAVEDVKRSGTVCWFHCPHCQAIYTTITADNGLLLDVKCL